MDYEKLLIKAKEAYNKCATGAEKRRLETIFPELAESEDERIRKALIKIINRIYQDDVDYAFVEDGICYEQLFNWLKKHKYTEEDLDKAYKCADKVQYRCGYEDAKKEIEKASDTVKDSEGELMRKEAIAIIKQYNIICEREGDKCYTADKVIAWLEKQGKKSTIIDVDKMVMEYAQTKDGDFGLPVNCMIGAYRKGINDALRLSLNLEKQELRKIDNYCKENCKGFQETDKCFADGECKAKRDAEQNPDWSEEDEKHCRYIIDFYLQKSYGATAMAIEWLKNLKNRMQPHWKPTEEQMENLEYAINMVDKCCEDSLQSLYNDLKKL